MTETHEPKRFPTLRLLFKSGCWILLLAFAFSFFGQYFFLADVLANFKVHFLILLVIGLLLSLNSNRGGLLKLALAMAIGWAAFDIGALWIDASQPPAGKTQIRVMSFNVLAHNTQFQAALDEIRSHDPDVVAILEYANEWHDAGEFLADEYPHRVSAPRWHGYGIVLFSKLPIVESQTVQLCEETIDAPAVEATFKIDGQDLRILATHTISPINDFRWELRNRQLEEISQWVNQDQSHTVLVGDFNAAPWSPWLRKLQASTGLRQSRHGFGPQATWPAFAGPLGVPIDHALVSPKVHIHSRYTGSNVGSDHRAIIVDLSIAK